MKNILVPISFSETPKVALSQAYRMAKEQGASLSLLHCYAAEEYNRKYDFGNMAYKKGIEKMMKDLYEETVGLKNEISPELITYPGFVSEIIGKISHKFDLLVLSRKTGFVSKSNKWFGDKIFYFTTKSRCPVLLLPLKSVAYTSSELKVIWHIKSMDNEADIINKNLAKLGIDSKLVVSKSLQQRTFISNFWESIVDYSKNHEEAQLTIISESYDNEEIDLMILVNHRKGMFERFLKDDVFQIISQFDIPILVLQS